MAGKTQAGRFAERVVDGVDDGGTPERVVIWIERKEGGVWGRPRGESQHRPSDQPRAGDYVFEGYELQDALDTANDTSRGRCVGRRRGRDDDAGNAPFRRSEILGPLERWFFGRR